MKCTRCEHRVELHPEYRGMVWESIPCSSCHYYEPSRRSEEITYGDQFEHPNANTYQIIDAASLRAEPTEAAAAITYYLGSSAVERGAVRRFVETFDERGELDCIDLVLNADETYQHNADNRGRSKPAQWIAMRKLREQLAAMGDD